MSALEKADSKMASPVISKDVVIIAGDVPGIDPATKVPSTESDKPAQTTQETDGKVPENEKNYSSYTDWEKRLIVLAATMGAFFSPFTAQIYFPALNSIAKDLDVSLSKVNLTITTYMVRLLFFAS